ncbi:MAG: efflux RND transporter periplasmic adaptor subunit [Acidobacteria bacterium]|nr:efflux RND transporter periplasmic adaptor subunit [Acidobacteriota bacterium]
MSSAALALAARRALTQAAERLAEAVRRVGEGLRPWLRREAWTADSLHEALAAARRRPRVAAAAFALAVLGPLVVMWGGSDPAAGIATATVREGPFHITIVETGTLQALRSVTYASNIQSNQAKIVALAPEGKLVQKGDLLILFDAAPFEEEIRRNQAALEQAQAELEKAKQGYKLQLIENQEKLAKARQDAERTDLELKDIEEGKGKLKEEETVAAVTQAERELKKAESALEDLRPLLAEGFITKLELEKADQQVAKAREDLRLAQRRRDSLMNYGRPLEVSQARSNALLTKESVRQAREEATHKVEQKRAEIAGADSRIQETASKLALAQQQLARTEVRADVPGIVVYREVFFGSEQRKPQVGDQVWANQPLLILPDISKMVVETKVRETDIHKVEKNQRVSVRVEAYPDLKLTGTVSLIGTLAQEERERRGTKFFGVTILVNESDPRLRPGMTAHVEIQVEERALALSVPLEAVFEHEGRTVCYLVAGRHVRPRDVVLGPSNQDFVIVEKGLSGGDRVCLREPGAPPSDFGSLTSQ